MLMHSQWKSYVHTDKDYASNFASGEYAADPKLLSVVQ